MAAWSWDQRGDNANKIVVHVAGIPEGRSTSRHDSRDLVSLADYCILSIIDSIPIGSSAGMKALGHAIYPLQFVIVLHYQEQRRSPHFVLTFA
jgi:hypothetical protein